MLQMTDGKIVEQLGNNGFGTSSSDRSANAAALTNTLAGSCGPGYGYVYSYPNYYQSVWHNYPVYICSDKTAKAIEILKSLESDKAIELKSVKRFIEMVEKIAAIL